MARFYANENVPEPVVAELRRLGHDVLTMLQSGHAGQALPDVDVLAFATADDRAVRAGPIAWKRGFGNLVLSNRAVMDKLAMNAIELIGDIDDRHQLHAQVPIELPTGRVRLIVLLAGEDEAGGMWAHGIAAAWSAELQDPREDIYSLDDGQPVHAPR